jgi:hypothetical protein
VGICNLARDYLIIKEEKKMANTNKVNLLLKRGLHKNLPKQGNFENGTLYFTTDEGGLYLGLEEGSGIRM